MPWLSMRRAFLLPVAGTLVLVVLAVFLWSVLHDEPQTEHYFTAEKRMAFDFNRSTSEPAKSLDVGLVLGPAELKGADKVEVAIRFRMEELARYPDTGSGTVHCDTYFRLNGKELNPSESRTFFVSGGGPGHWGLGRDEVGVTASETSYPSILGDRFILSKLNTRADNALTMTTECTQQITGRGPTWAVISLGPMDVFVTN
jgi:hypothetical protein